MIGLLIVMVPTAVYYQSVDRSSRHVQMAWLAIGGSGEIPDVNSQGTLPESQISGAASGAKEGTDGRENNVAPATVPGEPTGGTTAPGDASAGRLVFFKNEQASCSKCHRVQGEGGLIGPDLSKIGDKTTEEIIESILEPNRKITEGYSTLIVSTLDGQIVAGVLRENSDEKIVLVDAEGKETVILQDDVDETQPGLSAMPSTYRESLTPQQLQDLVEYLKSLRTE
ncbi:MAG: c-type cytochrome [Pirellulaceae bacterium]|nr:c-type cytochrome [Pirellulaceae bacterium]